MVRAVSLRRAAGGPTLLHAASVAPKTTQTLDVLLPAVSVQQTYRVRLLAGEGPATSVLREMHVPVTFPDLDAVERARETLVDAAAYEDRQEERPRWPTWLLRNVYLAAVLIAVGLGGVLFIRPGALRVLAAVAVAAGGTFAMWHVLSGVDVVLARRSGPLVALTCRRTTSWSRPARGVGPVYWSQGQMDRDDMVFEPGHRLTLTLRPDDVRVFRVEGGARRSPQTLPASAAAQSSGGR